MDFSVNPILLNLYFVCRISKMNIEFNSRMISMKEDVKMIDRKTKTTFMLCSIFSLSVLGLGFLSPLLGGGPSNPGPGFVLWGTAPLLVAIAIRIASKDWTDFGIKLNLKKNIIWYIIAFIAFPVMTLLSFLVCGWASVSVFSGFSMSKFMNAFLSALPVFFIFAVFEEFGWRGYLVPKLASTGMNIIMMNVIVAAVWAAWHLPYFRELSWVYSSEDLWTFIPRFFLAMFTFSMVYTEIRLLSKSVWPAVIMHCLMNSFGHPLAADFLHIAPGKEYLASSTGVVMIVLSALLGIGLYMWRMKHEGQKTPLITETGN